MTRHEAAVLAAIVTDYANGKEIEIWDSLRSEWVLNSDPSFGLPVNHYRIRKEQKYRPFNDSEECFEEMKKHEPFSYITDFDGEYYSVVRICEQVVIFGDGKLKNYEEILNEGYRFADGTPFGIKEEEE